MLKDERYKKTYQKVLPPPPYYCLLEARRALAPRSKTDVLFQIEKHSSFQKKSDLYFQAIKSCSIFQYLTKKLGKLSHLEFK